MARYDNITNTLQSNVYQNTTNAITGSILQSVLTSFINTLGTGSGFMGILTSNNKPTSVPDGKQWYLGYNASSTSTSINLSAVGLGTLTLTQSTIYIVYCDNNGWHAVNVLSGLSSMGDDKVTYDEMYDFGGRANLGQPIRIITTDIAAAGAYVVVSNDVVDKLKWIAVNGVAVEPVSNSVYLNAGTNYIDIVFEDNEYYTRENIVPNMAFAEVEVMRAAILPSTIFKIGDGAFQNTTIEWIVCPAAVVVEEGEGAFAGCEALDHVYVAQNLISDYQASWSIAPTFAKATIL